MYSQHLQVDNAIFVSGQVSISDEQAPKIIVNSIESVLSNEDFDKVPMQKSGKLYLKVSSIDSKVVSDIISLLREYKGDTEIVFFDVSQKKYVKASDVKITINDSIISALKMILGPDAVVYKD